MNGFNQRYHRALQEPRRISDSGVPGEMMNVRGRCEQGGHPCYERERQADPRISGADELLEQGACLIDLARWRLGDCSGVSSQTAAYFCDMPCEDDAFLTLKTPTGQTALLHPSWTKWKNCVSLQIRGRLAQVAISDRGDN
jgi:predicted dehydrogenase